MPIKEFILAPYVRLSDSLFIPLVHPLQINESSRNEEYEAIFAGRPMQISADTSDLLLRLARYGSTSRVPGKALWADLYEEGVAYDATDLYKEITNINGKFRPYVSYPRIGVFNASEKDDIVAIEKSGRGYSYGLTETIPFTKQSLEESYRIRGPQAYQRIPLDPIEAGAITAAVLDIRSGVLPFVGPYTAPDSIRNWFREANIRPISGISNDALAKLRFEAYAKVISHVDTPQLPFNDALLELKGFVDSLERSLTRPVIVNTLTPRTRESFFPIYGHK